VAPRLSPSDFERARTWATTIADTLLVGVPVHNDNDWRRYFPRGGLAINRRTGHWRSFSAGKGGVSPIGLVEFIIGELGRADDPVAWIDTFLRANPGIGPCDGDDSDDDMPASAEECRSILDKMVDVIGTSAEAYLQSRRLDTPYPATGFIADARCGEHALVGILRSHDRIVGVQLLYIDPAGCKSEITPKRRRFMLETAADAVFEMGYAGESTDVVVCEGLEDTLSVFRYGKRRCRVVGLPGIAALAHLKFAPGIKVTTVCDGDAPGSTAAKALQAGLDQLILQGVDAHVTATPPLGEDANSILVHGGVDGLVAFLDSAAPAILSLEGEIERLALLAQLDYAKVRRQEARRLGITTAILDDEVRKARERNAAAQQSAQNDDDDWADIQDAPVWLTPVDGAELLDDLDKALTRFVVMDDEQRWTTALWIVFTHAFAAAQDALKLWVTSAEPRSGKSRLLEVLEPLVRRGFAPGRATAAVLMRITEAHKPTLLLDECDTYVVGDEQLRNLLDNSFTISKATIWICVGDDKTPTGFSVWVPQVLAGLGKLDPTVADRCVRLELERKPRVQKVERLRRRNRQQLQELAQKAARWAEDNVPGLIDEIENDRIVIPEQVNDRASDGWEMLFAIAKFAGSHWPDRAQQAALKLSGDGAVAEDASIGVQLLSDIRDVFEAMGLPLNKQRISSADLVFRLNQMIDRPWPEFGARGMPLSQTALARLLQPFHIGPKNKNIRFGNAVTKGYKRSWFEKVFARYLPPLEPPSEELSPDEEPSYAGNSRYTATNEQFHEEFRGSEADFEAATKGLFVPDVAASDIDEKPSKTAAFDGICSGVAAKTGEGSYPPEENPLNGGSEPISGAKTAGEDVAQHPNGEDNEAISEVEKLIISTWREHRDWSPTKVAKACGVTAKRAKAVITQFTAAGGAP
jgi:Protein of unknown function (DUF3631)